MGISQGDSTLGLGCTVRNSEPSLQKLIEEAEIWYPEVEKVLHAE